MHDLWVRRIGGGLLCAVLVSVLLFVPAAAAGDTITLTGEIGGMYEIPAGVTRVILSGVQAADFESGIKLPASAEVVLADGTENVCGIMAQGDLRVTGSGALLGGSGIYAFGDLTLDLTGSVVLEGGQLAAFGGDVIINSGTYRLQSLPEGGGGLIVASGGDVLLNGGDVRIYNDTVGVTSTDGTITVSDTALDISAADDVMIANTITLPEALQDAVEIHANNADGTGQNIVVAGTSARHLTVNGDAAKCAAEQGEPVIQNGKTDVGAAVSLGERDPEAEIIVPETGSGESSALPWILIAVGAAAVIAAAVVLLRNKRGKNKTDKKERRT